MVFLQQREDHRPPSKDYYPFEVIRSKYLARRSHGEMPGNKFQGRLTPPCKGRGQGKRGAVDGNRKMGGEVQGTRPECWRRRWKARELVGGSPRR
ncbi:hypothetical protein KM043_005148 [Ampulex compressa]|nr:hypothetical protein KM043_005148 [Ampulex compressa]